MIFQHSPFEIPFPTFWARKIELTVNHMFYFQLTLICTATGYPKPELEFYQMDKYNMYYAMSGDTHWDLEQLRSRYTALHSEFRHEEYNNVTEISTKLKTTTITKEYVKWLRENTVRQLSPQGVACVAWNDFSHNIAFWHPKALETDKGGTVYEEKKPKTDNEAKEETKNEEKGEKTHGKEGETHKDKETPNEIEEGHAFQEPTMSMIIEESEKAHKVNSVNEEKDKEMPNEIEEGHAFQEPTMSMIIEESEKAHKVNSVNEEKEGHAVDEPTMHKLRGPTRGDVVET